MSIELPHPILLYLLKEKPMCRIKQWRSELNLNG